MQCWDITEQLRAQTLTFSSTLGQGREKDRKKDVKKVAYPTLLTMIVAKVFKSTCDTEMFYAHGQCID